MYDNGHAWCRLLQNRVRHSVWRGNLYIYDTSIINNPESLSQYHVVPTTSQYTVGYRDNNRDNVGNQPVALLTSPPRRLYQARSVVVVSIYYTRETRRRRGHHSTYRNIIQAVAAAPDSYRSILTKEGGGNRKKEQKCGGGKKETCSHITHHDRHNQKQKSQGIRQSHRTVPHNATILPSTFHLPPSTLVRPHN